MLKHYIPAEQLATLQDLVAAHYAIGWYRPTAVGIIEDVSTNRVLVSHSPKGDAWGFPQGGIGPEERVLDALLREIWEELGIPDEELTVARFCHAGTLDTPGRKRDGFTRGKLYLYFHVQREGSTPIRYKQDEVDSHQWVRLASAPEKVLDLCARTPEKRDSLVAALGHLFEGT